MSVRPIQRLTAAVALASVLLLGFAGAVSAAPPVFDSGQFVVPASDLVDLDHGQAQTTAGEEDAWFEIVGPGQRWLRVSGGGEFLKSGSTKPTYNQCKGAFVTPGSYNLTKNVGNWFCAHTNKHRVDRFKVVSVNDSQLVLKFTTWS